MKMKTYRYRKDLTSYHFEIKHKFVKGVIRLQQQGRISVLEMKEIPEDMGFPQWYRPMPGEFTFAGLSGRKAEIVVLTNCNIERIVLAGKSNIETYSGYELLEMR